MYVDIKEKPYPNDLCILSSLNLKKHVFSGAKSALGIYGASGVNRLDLTTFTFPQQTNNQQHMILYSVYSQSSAILYTHKLVGKNTETKASFSAFIDISFLGFEVFLNHILGLRLLAIVLWAEN